MLCVNTGRLYRGTQPLSSTTSRQTRWWMVAALLCWTNRTEQYNTMARTKQSVKQLGAPLEDKEQQAGHMEKQLVKPDGDSDDSDDDSDKTDDDDNGTAGAAEAIAATDSQGDSSRSSGAGSKPRTYVASEDESEDSGMSDVSSPFFEAVSSSDEKDLKELRKTNPTYKSMEEERYQICKFKRHTRLLRLVANY